MLAALRVAHGKLLTVGFDRANAPAFGASPRAADALLLLLIGGFTIVAVQALGTLLVLAMLVGPAATARLVTDRLRSMMALAATIAAAGGAAGLYLSYYADTAAGASIAAVIVAVHIAAVAGLRLSTGPSKGRASDGPRTRALSAVRSATASRAARRARWCRSAARRPPCTRGRRSRTR